MLGRYFGAALLPLWIRRPDDESRKLLHRPLPLAVFLSVATVFVVWGGGL
jgi:hypothetical protein